MSREIVEFDLSKVEKQIEECHEIKGSWEKYHWTDDKDSFLLKYWGIKKQCDVARLLNTTTSTARERYRKLTGK